MEAVVSYNRVTYQDNEPYPSKPTIVEEHSESIVISKLSSVNNNSQDQKKILRLIGMNLLPKFFKESPKLTPKTKLFKNSQSISMKKDKESIQSSNL